MPKRHADREIKTSFRRRRATRPVGLQDRRGIRAPGAGRSPSRVQVFEVELKGAESTDAVLKAIDTAIPSPVMFELTRASGEIQVAAARKELASVDQRSSSYFRSAWLPEAPGSQDLPAGARPRAASTRRSWRPAVRGRTTRRGTVGGDRQNGQTANSSARSMHLTRRLRTEPQLNRKVEIRRDLKTKQAELEELK